MLGTFLTLLTIAVIAIPIVFVVKMVRRLRQVTRGFSDPASLQRVFAESAAAALRRAGVDSQAIAKLEVLGQGPAVDRVAEQRAADHEPRPQPSRLHSRQRARPPVAPLGGFDTGASFRLSEPPDVGEPHAPFAISNWFAVALFAGAAGYFFLR